MSLLLLRLQYLIANFDILTLNQRFNAKKIIKNYIRIDPKTKNEKGKHRRQVSPCGHQHEYRGRAATAVR